MYEFLRYFGYLLFIRYNDNQFLYCSCPHMAFILVEERDNKLENKQDNF